MRPLVWLLAADGRGGTSINTKFEVQNGKFDTGAIETMPVAFHDADDSVANERLDMKADDKVLDEFRQVTLRLSDMDVGTDFDEALGWMTEVFFKNQIAQIRMKSHQCCCCSPLKCNDRRAWGTKSWRNFDHKSMGQRRDGCSSKDGGRINKLVARMEWKAGISVIRRIGGCKSKRRCKRNRQSKQNSGKRWGKMS
jgi:hypothetical protein